jgi:thiamine pyrophosphate-dependent acetolactate synthase large subunit-like protein
MKYQWWTCVNAVWKKAAAPFKEAQAVSIIMGLWCTRARVSSTTAAVATRVKVRAADRSSGNTILPRSNPGMRQMHGVK